LLAGLVFSPDGKLLAATGFDSTVKVWDAATGQLRNNFKGHTGTVAGVGFTPDSKRIISMSMDGTLKTWDAAAVDEPLPLEGNYSPLIGAMAVAPDGKRLAQVVWSGTKNQGKSQLKLWDAATGKELTTINGDFGLFVPVTFSPDGKHLAAMVPSRVGAKLALQVKVWAATNGKELLTVDGAFREVDAKGVQLNGGPLTFSPDGQRMAAWLTCGDTAKQRHEVRVWDAATGQQLWSIDGSPYNDLLRLAFTADGERLAATGHIMEAGKVFTGVTLWDTASGHALFSWRTSSLMSSFDLSSDAKRFAAVVSMGPATPLRSQLKLWNIATGRELLTREVRVGTNLMGGFSPDGKNLAVAISTGTLLSPAHDLQVWDALTGQERIVLKLGGLGLVTFSPDSKRIVTCGGYSALTGGAGNEVTVWDAATGVDLLTLHWQPSITGLSFTSDGHRLVLRSNGSFFTEQAVPIPQVQLLDATPLPEKRSAEADSR
jgi:WD40 repeat protein